MLGRAAALAALGDPLAAVVSNEHEFVDVGGCSGDLVGVGDIPTGVQLSACNGGLDIFVDKSHDYISPELKPPEPCQGR